jgi:hypothetical protein
VKLDTISRITLPDGIVRPRKLQRLIRQRQKTVVEAQVRLEGTLKKYGWSVTDLNETKEDYPESNDRRIIIDRYKEALGAKKRSDFDEKRKRRWLRRSTRWTRSSLPIRTIWESLKFEKTDVQSVERKAGEIDLIWSESDQRSRAGLMLGIIPTSGALLEEAFTPKQHSGNKTSGRVLTLAMTVPFDIVETGFRPVAPSSELMASLNADNKSRMDMIVELDKINIHTRRCRNDERLGGEIDHT